MEHFKLQAMVYPRQLLQDLKRRHHTQPITIFVAQEKSNKPIWTVVHIYKWDCNVKHQYSADRRPQSKQEEMKSYWLHNTLREKQHDDHR